MTAAAWRISRGSPGPEEIAALAVVLSAVLTGRAQSAIRQEIGGGTGPEAAAGSTGAVRGRSRERPRWGAAGGRSARSWVERPLPGWRDAA